MMHLINELVQSMLGLLISSSAVTALLVLALGWYSRPRIGYRRYSDTSDRHITRFLIHNLEPVDETEEFALLIDAGGEIARVEVFAGPHASPGIPTAKLIDGRLPISFRSFPGEAVFALTVETKEPGRDVNLLVADNSKTKPRGFGELRNFGRVSQVKYFLPRWFIGVATALVAFFVGLGMVGGGVFGTDVVSMILLIVSSIFVFFMCVPVSGKETAQGYLGWDMPDVVWPEQKK